MDQETQIKGNEEIYYIRQSSGVLITNFVIIQLILIVTFVCVVVLCNILNNFADVSFGWIISSSAVILVLFDILLCIRLVLTWKSLQYVIQKGELLIRKGIIQKHEKLYALNQVETISVRQGIMGKLQNYGTIVIRSPLLDQQIVLPNIPEPRKYEKILLTPTPKNPNTITQLIPEVSKK